MERANLGGAFTYQLVSIAQLVDTPVQKVLARRFFNRNSITPQQLEAEIKTHARHEDDADDSRGCLLERKADARLAEVSPRQRIARNTPMLEAAGACDPRPVGTTSESPVCEALTATIVPTATSSVARCLGMVV